jgi:hypothetical protein
VVTKWGATGVGKFRHLAFRLPKTIKHEIETEVKYLKLTPKTGYPALFKAIESAVRLFRHCRDMAADSSPAKVRENLQNIQKRALDLNEAFNQLDGNSSHVLAQYIELNEVRTNQLGGLLSATIQAIADAEKFPMRGRLPDNARIILVLELAHVLEDHLGLKYTTSKRSKFESLVSIIYQEATGRSRSGEVHELLRSAKKWCRLANPDGSVEFLPREEI